MDRKGLTKMVSETLLPMGFLKKGNYWILDTGDLKKIVSLQKSHYGNFFYFNYGFTVNKVPIEDLTMHIYYRLSSLDLIERNRIDELLNFDTNISDDDRYKELSKVFQKNLVDEIKNINTEQELLSELKKQPNFNNVPVTVKEYFGLE